MVPQTEVDGWLDALLRNHALPAWLSGGAPESDVVVSTRVRLARNLAGLPFPAACTRKQLLTVAAHTRRALPGVFEERSIISSAERSLLIASRLLSPNHELDALRSVFVSLDRSASIMVNEEDHLRVQSVAGGLDVRSARERTEGLTTELAERLPFAKSERRGFLCAWPGNAGKGLRIGMMLHLGALALAESKPEVPQGVAFRGVLGEGSRGLGGFVQISATQLPERELLRFVGVLIDSERSARKSLPAGQLEERVEEALKMLRDDAELTIEKTADIVSLLRLSAAIDPQGRTPREFDALLAVLDLGGDDSIATTLKRRSLIQRFLAMTLPWQHAAG